MHFRALSREYQNWQTLFEGLTFSLGGLALPNWHANAPMPMPGYFPGFMVINDSDCQRVYMHNATAEF